MGKASKTRFVTSSQLAVATGVTLSTVHYYTAMGLLQADRQTGNSRLYDVRETKARLQYIARLRQEGYSLALIRTMLSKAQQDRLRGES